LGVRGQMEIGKRRPTDAIRPRGLEREPHAAVVDDIAVRGVLLTGSEYRGVVLGPWRSAGDARKHDLAVGNVVDKGRPSREGQVYEGANDDRQQHRDGYPKRSHSLGGRADESVRCQARGRGDRHR